jgi:hypothetical protein
VFRVGDPVPEEHRKGAERQRATEGARVPAKRAGCSAWGTPNPRRLHRVASFIQPKARLADLRVAVTTLPTPAPECST